MKATCCLAEDTLVMRDFKESVELDARAELAEEGTVGVLETHGRPRLSRHKRKVHLVDDEVVRKPFFAVVVEIKHEDEEDDVIKSEACSSSGRLPNGHQREFVFTENGSRRGVVVFETLSCVLEAERVFLWQCSDECLVKLLIKRKDRSVACEA